MRMRPEAVASMVPLLSQAGNPSSLHAAGRAARRHLEEARGRSPRIWAHGRRRSFSPRAARSRITSPSPGSSPPAVPAIRVAVASSSRPSSTTRSWTVRGAGRGTGPRARHHRRRRAGLHRPGRAARRGRRPCRRDRRHLGDVGQQRGRHRTTGGAGRGPRASTASPVHSDAIAAAGHIPSTSATAGWRRCPSPVTSSAVRRASAPSSWAATPRVRPCCAAVGTSAISAQARRTSQARSVWLPVWRLPPPTSSSRRRRSGHARPVVRPPADCRGHARQRSARRVAPARQTRMCHLRDAGRFAAHAARCAGNRVFDQFGL